MARFRAEGARSPISNLEWRPFGLLPDGRRSERHPNSPKAEPAYNGTELMTSVISCALSSHAMLTAVVPKNGRKAHVLGEFERLVRSGAAACRSRGTAARLGVSLNAICVSVYSASAFPFSRPLELSIPLWAGWWHRISQPTAPR
jgi:hypothetical protein